MAQYSLSTSPVQRSAGSSAVAHLAYICGGCYTDQRTGRECDYTRRGGVAGVAAAIVLPAGEQGALSAAMARETLWNMAEAAEKRKDGTPARKVLVALPHELGPGERLALTQEYAQWMADRYHVAVDFALHAPDKQGDQRNFHAHLLLTTREIRGGQLADKAQLEWNGTRLKEAGLPGGKAMLHELRERWETVQNAALARHAPEAEKVSSKRLQVQQEVQKNRRVELEHAGRYEEAEQARGKSLVLGRSAQPHVGWKSTELERMGVTTRLGEQRREAQREHRVRRDLVVFLKERACREVDSLKRAAAQAAERLAVRQAAEAEAAQRKLFKPAEQTNEFLLGLANSQSGSFRLDRQATAILYDALYGAVNRRSLYGEAGGKGSNEVKMLEAGVRSKADGTITLNLLGLATLVARWVGQACEYVITPYSGQKLAFAARIRSGAIDQKTWDEKVLTNRRDAPQRPALGRAKTKDTQDRGR